MDATKRPIKISPELVNYADKHQIFENMKSLLELLIIDRPSNPIKYLLDHLKKDVDSNVPRIFVLGPPASGKFTIAKMLAGRLQCQLLTPHSVFSQCDNDVKNAGMDCLNNGWPVSPNIWSRAIKFRTKMFDCEKTGYVLVGYPMTKEQVYAMQCDGVFPTHVIVLTTPDFVLMERADGKRVDPQTGDIYHTTFDPPPDQVVKDRLVKPNGYDEQTMRLKLTEYHRNSALVIPLYWHVIQEISADQPIADVFHIALEFSMKLPRSPALRTPRVLLIGPPGSGKSTIANLICKKYGLVKIKCSELIRSSIADESKHGLAMRSYVEKKIPVPDSILMQLLEEKLSDLCCSTYGWLLYGYPKSLKQAEQLSMAKLEPNRVFFIEVPSFVSMERCCERRLDPITGERYHMSYNPPMSATVSARVLKHPKDDSKVVKHRLTEYTNYNLELKEFYKDHMVIDGNLDLQNVFELVESYLINPLPRKLA